MSVAHDDVVRATVGMVHSGVGVVQNVFYYQQHDLVTASNDEVIDAIGDLLLAAYQGAAGAIADEIAGTLIEFALRDTGTGDFNAVGSYDFSGFSGSDASEGYVSFAAGVISFTLENVGQLGRKFLPGLTDNTVQLQTITSGCIAEYVDWADDVMQPATGIVADMRPGVWSVKNSVFRPYAGTALIQTLVGTQVRRKTGVGI